MSLFSCEFDANGYCCMFHCRGKDTQYGCTGSARSCPNLKFLYEDPAVDLTDIHRLEAQARQEASRLARGNTASQTARGVSLPADADPDEEQRRLEAKLRQQELERRRAEAAEQGRRTPEDVRRARLRNAFICLLLTAALWHKVVIVPEFFNGALGGILDNIKAALFAGFVSLPLALAMHFGTLLYGREAVFGKTFRGSAFLISYLATLIPSLLAFFLVWTAAVRLLGIEDPAAFIIYSSSFEIYITACIPAWFLNHYAMGKIWDKGFKYYIEQGRRDAQSDME